LGTNFNIDTLLELNPERLPGYNHTLTQTYQGFIGLLDSFRKGNKTHFEHYCGILECNLTNEEAFLILAYTGACSSWLNDDKRNNLEYSSEGKKLYADSLNETLTKLTSFNDAIVFRMDSPSGDSKEILRWFKRKVSSVFTIPYFLSTAKEDYQNTPITWIIKTLPNNSLGKDISNITNNKYEKEVLFRRNSCFQITKVQIGKAQVFLEEVGASSVINFSLTGFYFRNF